MNFKRLLFLGYLILVLCPSVRQATAQTPHTGNFLTKPTPARLHHPQMFSALSVEQRGHSGLSQRAMLEIGAVTLTGIGHFISNALDANKVYIPLVSLGWGAYLYHRARTDQKFLSDVGFTSSGLRGGFRDATFVALGAMTLMTGTAVRKGSLTLHRDMIPLLLLYPAWGLVQQFLVQGMVTRNLTEADLASYVVTPISASLFGLVHLPDWKMTVGTFALGLAFTPIYLKHGNLWPLGLYHGCLGVFFYFWVLERNPFQDVVDKHSRENVHTGIDVDGWGNPLLRLQVKF